MYLKLLKILATCVFVALLSSTQAFASMSDMSLFRATNISMNGAEAFQSPVCKKGMSL
jgi:hypothetical protein